MLVCIHLTIAVFIHFLILISSVLSLSFGSFCPCNWIRRQRPLNGNSFFSVHLSFFLFFYISFIMKFIFHKRCKTLIYDSCDIRWLRFWYIRTLHSAFFSVVSLLYLLIFIVIVPTKCIVVLCYMRIFISGAAIHMHMWKKKQL